jgi:OOP family OmpA-OmpF porin
MADPRKPADASCTDDLERLQDLILGREKARLHRLDRRVTDLELRTADVAEALPGARNRLVDDPVSKSELEQPIVHTIRGAIKRDTASFAEALFPVLGPAIRRAVADALKSLVQRINVALEHSFTVKGLRWRLEAARTGVPFAQIVLHHTMVYAIQEAFLIQRNTGLVLASVHRDEALALDEDAVSAMLTAIQSFIQDSFGVSGDEPLRSAELGDRTLWVINGPEAVLACVISGNPPRDVRDELMDLLETMHARFSDRFKKRPEALAGNSGLHALMAECLREEMDQSSGSAAGFGGRLAWAAVGLAVLLAVVWLGWNSVQRNRLEAQITAVLESEPGYHLSGHGYEDGLLWFSGLRDPLAPAPAAVLEAAAIPPAGVRFRFEAFQSLEPVMIGRQLRAALGLPASIELQVDGATLRVNGQLTSTQYRQLEGLPLTHPLIRSVDLGGSRLAAAEAVERAREMLEPPDTAAVMAAGDDLVVSGSASPAWFADARRGRQSIGGWPLDFSPMAAALAAEFRGLAGRLDGREFLFPRRDSLGPVTLAELERLAPDLRRLQDLARVLDLPALVAVHGFADGTGTAEQNRVMSRMRARAVLDVLEEHGVDVSAVEIRQGAWAGGAEDPARRKVVVSITSGDGP